MYQKLAGLVNQSHKVLNACKSARKILEFNHIVPN